MITAKEPNPAGSVPQGGALPPPASLAAAPRRAIQAALALVALHLALYLPGLGQRDFWAPDEPRFAVIAREMVESGDWLVPRMNDEPIALLPPFTYWLAALPSLVTGTFDEGTARIALVTSGALALAAVFLLGLRIGGSLGAGLAAAVALATTAQFGWQTRFLQADIHLFAGTTWALTLFYLGYLTPHRRTMYYTLMGVAIAWGFLAKGPVAAVVPGLVILVFLLVRRELGAALLRQRGFWAGVALCLALVLPWYVAACLRAGSAFAHELIIKHNFGMFADTWSHEEPITYYFGQLPVFLLPWTLLVPVAFVHLFARGAAAPAATGARRDALFLSLWAGVLLVFFSVSDAKQAKYTLPLYPALGVALGLMATEFGALRALHPRWWSFARGSLVAVLGVLGAAAACLPAAVLCHQTGLVTFPDSLAPYVERWSLPPVEDLAPLADLFALPLALAGAIALATAILGVRSAWRGRLGAAAAALALFMVITGGIVQWILAPALNPLKSGREICARIAEHAPPGTPIGIYAVGRRQHGDYIYYSGRRTLTFRDPTWLQNDREEEARRLEAYLRRPEQVWVLAKETRYEQVVLARFGELTHELFRSHKGGNPLVFFTNRPPDGAANHEHREEQP